MDIPLRGVRVCPTFLVLCEFVQVTVCYDLFASCLKLLVALMLDGRLNDRIFVGQAMTS